MFTDPVIETESRLRNRLNNDKKKQELLAAELVRMLEGASEVATNQTSGSRDGGADIFFRWGDLKGIGAVSFSNDASDKEDRNQKEKKFERDVKSAKINHPDATVFIFVTNVNFTEHQRKLMLDFAVRSGFANAIVLGRDNIVRLLNTAEGLLPRYIYLGMTMSDDEQRMVFDRWGSGILEVVSRNFNRVDGRLEKLNFLSQAQFPIEYISVNVKVPAESTLETLKSNFGFLLQIRDRGWLKHEFAFATNETDSAGDMVSFRSTLKVRRSLTEESEVSHHALSLDGEIEFRLNFEDEELNLPRMKLMDLNRSQFAFWANAAGRDIIESISVVVNSWEVARYDFADISRVIENASDFYGSGTSFNSAVNTFIKKSCPHLLIADSQRFDANKRTPKFLPNASDAWNDLVRGDGLFPPDISYLFWSDMAFPSEQR